MIHPDIIKKLCYEYGIGFVIIVAIIITTGFSIFKHYGSESMERFVYLNGKFFDRVSNTPWLCKRGKNKNNKE
jgi:hypothetical protein